LKIPCGAAGGLVAGRLRGLVGTREEKQRIVAAPYNKAVAFTCGLVVGAFLFQRFGFDTKRVLYGWEWYLGAVLLAGIGLAGIFTQARLTSAIGLGLGPTLVFCIEVVVLHPAESMWPIVLPMVFLFSLPAPIIGSGISQLLTRIRFHRAVYFVALTTALVIGALLPNIQKALHQRLETKTVPGILRQIYDAELIYRGRQPDGNFACDGTLLPGAVGKLGWTPGIDPKIKNTLVVQYYTISFDCGIKSTGFRVSALSNEGYIPAPPMWMDEGGKLVVVPIPPKWPNTH